MSWYTLTVHLSSDPQVICRLAEVITGFERPILDQAISEICGKLGTLLIDSAYFYSKGDSFYIQMDKGINYHLHVVFEAEHTQHLKSINANIKTWTEKAFKKYNEKYYGSPDFQPLLMRALTIQPKRNRSGAWAKIDPISYIEKYLKPKKPAQSWIAENFMNYVTPHEEEELLPTVEERPKLLSGYTTHALDYIVYKNECIEQGICTAEQMQTKLPVLYSNAICKPNGSKWIKDLLQETRLEITKQTLFHFARKYKTDMCEPDNFITNILKHNGIDVEQFCIDLYKWSNHRTGKRNCLVLYGRPSTGKTLIAQGIAKVAPTYGMVNKNNENFPFTACHNQNLIWMEEGRLTSKLIEEWKAITGGTPVLIDVKQRAEQHEIKRTPVLWTTNGDPCAVYNGNTIDYSHKSALLERYIMYQLDTKLTTAVYGMYPSSNAMMTGIGECVHFGYFMTNLSPRRLSSQVWHHAGMLKTSLKIKERLQ
nr:MAG: NS1 protein [Parvovirinae sp.]